MCDGTQTSCAIDPITGAAGAASAAGHAVTDAAGRAVTGIASDAVGAVAGDWLQSEMSSFVTWCGKAVIWATSWWAGGTTMDPNTPTVIGLQRQIVPIALLILTFGVFWQAGKVIVSRKPAPLVDVVSGLVRYVAVSVAGLAFWEAVIQLCDYATAMILNSTKQDFGTALGQDLIGLAAPGSVSGPALPMLALLVIGLVLMIVSCIQWLLAWVRLAGIQILAVLLPLAAAGSITESTRAWLRKVNAWMLALVTYKLIAAIIYRIGFAFLVGPLPGTQPDMAPVSRTMIGLMVLGLAVFCLPVMMKFFAFLGADTSGGGVAGAVLGAGAVAAGSVKLAGMLRGGASSSAAQVAANGPGGPGGAGPSGGPGGAGPSGGPAALPPGGSPSPAPAAPPGPGGPPGPAPTTSPGSPTGGPAPGAGQGGGNQTGNQSPPSGSGTQPGQSPGQSCTAPGASPAPATSAPGATSTPGVTPATTPAAGAGTAGVGAAGAGAAGAGTAGAGTAAATAGPAGVVVAAGAAAVRQVSSQAHGVGGQPPETS